MGAMHEHRDFLATVPAIVLWGCFGGLCLAAVHLFLQGTWTRLLDYNYTLSPMYPFQVIGVSALLLWIFGVTAADLFCKVRAPWPGSVLTGLVSGICTALVFAATIVICDMLSRPPVVLYSNDPFMVRVFLDHLFHQWRIPLAGFLVISGILQALGSWYRASGHGRNGAPAPLAETFRFRDYRRIVFILLAILVIPQGLIFLGMSSGIIGEQCTCYSINDTVSVSRTGPDSLMLVMIPDPDTVRKTSAPLPTLQILINEKDLSNQSAIARQGLDDTIDPPKGLIYQEGASVILKGRDVTGNETSPARLAVIITYPEKGNRAIIVDHDF
jgi:hypothetical protein